MRKLPKIISTLLCLILIFSGCAPKYDIVDYNDYSSKLLENNFSSGEIDFYSSDIADFSSIVSYEQLISDDFGSLGGSSSVISSNPLSSDILFNSSYEISSDSSQIIPSATTTSNPTTTTSSSTTTSTNTTNPTTTTTTEPTTTNPVTTTSNPNSNIQNGSNSNYKPLYYSNMKAVWLSYYNFYYNIKGETAASFRSYAKSVMQKIKNFGFNTVIVHLRSHGDAIYNSAYFPWSKIVDTAPSFDPTQILIEEAHALGLSFHAWFNPLRLDTPYNLAKIDNKYQTKKWYNTKYGDYVVKSGSFCYLNPAYSEVRTLIINGAKEIAQKYKVDALHIDDYFYPTTDASFDSKAYASLGGGKTLANFRRNNINILVKGIYSAVKSVNSKLKFGISPGGNVERNYNELYADTTLWLQTGGYMDYCIPQIYWGYKHNTHDFTKITNQWKGLATNNNVDLIIGLAFYKVNNTEIPEYSSAIKEMREEWLTDHTIISRQVKDTKTLLGSKYSGFAIFDYEYLFDKNTSFHQKARDELKKVM